MRKIIVIGTLHAGSTPKNELKEVFIQYKPTQILVEISQNDIESEDIGEYPPEMIFTYKWARKNDIKVNGFDSKINVFKEGVSKKDNEDLIERQGEIIDKYSWKDFNRKEIERLLDGGEDIVDPEKERMREQEMLENIEKVMDKQGTVLIITGCGHLNFFEESIDNAVFPFRN